MTAYIPPPEEEKEEGSESIDEGVHFELSPPLYAPTTEGDGAGASAAGPPYKTYRAADCEITIPPINGCSVWEQAIKGYFWYNGHEAWWKGEQRPPRCPGHGTPFIVEPEYFICDFEGPNHQPYGRGYHITSQVWYHVNWLKLLHKDEKAVTVRMFGDGEAFGHTNGCVCNPTVPGQDEGPSY